MNRFLIQHYFDSVAMNAGVRPAVFCLNERISYEELFTRSNRLAHSLKKHGVERGSRVMLMTPKSIGAVIAILGVLKADASYVPVDSEGPLGRTKEIYLDCGPAAIVCEASGVQRALDVVQNGNSQTSIFILSKKQESAGEEAVVWGEDIDRETGEQPIYQNTDEDLAYIIYTSGSTGKPKGVMVSHLNVMRYIEWATDYFDITEKDGILNTSPLHFDMSIFDLFCPLTCGGSLTLAPKNLQLFPIKLIEVIEKNTITLWKAASFFLSYFVKTRVIKSDRMKELKKLIFSGERLPAKYLIEWMKAYPNKEFYNAYGPTEATGISTCYRIKEPPANPFEQIPIGKACLNTEVFALNEKGEMIREGEIGELYIRSSCLSKGYWNDRLKTESTFIKNPLNSQYDEKVYRTGDNVKLLPGGNLVFIGRKDNQVKYLGYRIELGEIEASLQGIDSVAEAAVMSFQSDENEEPEIVAFIEVAGGANIDQLREVLKKRLPGYMVPKRIEVINKIPRTGNGKVDREFLKIRNGEGEKGERKL